MKTYTLLTIIYVIECCICDCVISTNKSGSDMEGQQQSNPLVLMSVSNVKSDANYSFRIKRQHNHAFANPLNGLLNSVFNKKLGLIGSLSSISSSTKGGDAETQHPTYEYSPPLPGKPFDWLSLKKSVFATLLQAVKAITGGVVALNGQLVKIKSYIVAAKGHLLSIKGDSITAFGKYLTAHAFASHQPASILAPSSLNDYPSTGAGGSNYPLIETSRIRNSPDSAYPQDDNKAVIKYPTDYNKDSSLHSKRAASLHYYATENDNFFNEERKMANDVTNS